MAAKNSEYPTAAATTRAWPTGLPVSVRAMAITTMALTSIAAIAESQVGAAVHQVATREPMRPFRTFSSFFSKRRPMAPALHSSQVWSIHDQRQG